MWAGQDIDNAVLPIGRPLKDYTCYVLDPNTYEPVSAGEDGVLFVAGPGVAIGYLDKELTERKFVKNPWSEDPAYGRMYNTGDVVRVDEGGMYWFRGRLDLQAKVRYFYSPFLLFIILFFLSSYRSKLFIFCSFPPLFAFVLFVIEFTNYIFACRFADTSLS